MINYNNSSFLIKTILLVLSLLFYISTVSSTPISGDCTFQSPYNNAISDLSELKLPSNGGFQISSGQIKYLFNICNSTNACPYNQSQSCQINESDPLTSFQTGDINFGEFDFNSGLTLKYKTNNNNNSECLDGITSIFNFRCIEEDGTINKLYTSLPIYNESLCTYTYLIKSSYSCLSKGIYLPKDEIQFISGSTNNQVKIYYIYGNGTEILGDEILFFLKSSFNGTIYKFTKENKNLNYEIDTYDRMVVYTLLVPKDGYGSGDLIASIKNYDDSDTTNVISKQSYKYSKPIIESVSQVDLYPNNGVSKITISGKHFGYSTMNQTDARVILLNQNCENTQVIDSETIICELNVNYIRNSDLRSTSSIVRIGDISSDTLINIFPFLPSWKKCPTKNWFSKNYDSSSSTICNGNGYCDSSLNCICNKDYTSYDCSVKVSSILPISNSPKTLNSNEFSLSISEDSGYSISISHIRQVNSFGFPENSITVDSLSNKQNQNSTSQGFKFTADNFKNDLFSTISTNTKLISSTKNPYFNYFGNNLPISNNSAIVSLQINNLKQQEEQDNQYIEFIFQVKSINKEKEIEIQQVENGYIQIREKEQNDNYLLFTLANKFPYANSFKLTDYITTCYILEQQQKPKNNNFTAYIAVQFQLINNTSFEIGSSFNLYSDINGINDNNDNSWPNWKIYFVIACGVIGLILLLGTLLFIHQKSKINRTILDINSALSKSSRDAVLINTPNSSINNRNQEPEKEPNIYMDENPITASSSNISISQHYEPDDHDTLPPHYDTIGGGNSNNIEIISKPNSTPSNQERRHIENSESDVEIKTVKVGEGCKTQ